MEHAAEQRREAEAQLSEELCQEFAELELRLQLEIYDARATRRPEAYVWRVAAARALICLGSSDEALKQLTPLPSLAGIEPTAIDSVAVALEALLLAAEAQQRRHQFADALSHYRQLMDHGERLLTASSTSATSESSEASESSKWSEARELWARAARQGARLAGAMGQGDVANLWSERAKAADFEAMGPKSASEGRQTGFDSG